MTKKLNFGRAGVSGSAVALCLALTGCSVDKGGLATGSAPATTPASAGVGGTPSTGGTAGAAGRGSPTPPPAAETPRPQAGATGSTPPPPPPAAGASGTAAPPPDAAPPATTPPPPRADAAAPPPPPAPDAAVLPPDSAPPLPPACPDDKTLALCVSFDGPGTEPTDGSPHHHTLTSREITLAAGVGQLGARGVIKAAESEAFDAKEITIEAWAKPNELPESQGGLGGGQGRNGNSVTIVDNDDQYGLYVQSDGSVACRLGSGGFQATSTTKIKAKVWSSLACTFNDDGITVFVDGKKAGVSDFGFPLSDNGRMGVSIGQSAQSSFGGAGQFQGDLDNVRIWRSVRSAKQICAAAAACD